MIEGPIDANSRQIPALPNLVSADSSDPCARQRSPFHQNGQNICSIDRDNARRFHAFLVEPGRGNGAEKKRGSGAGNLTFVLGERILHRLHPISAGQASCLCTLREAPTDFCARVAHERSHEVSIFPWSYWPRR